MQLTFRQANELMNTDPQHFKTLVHERYIPKHLYESVPQLKVPIVCCISNVLLFLLSSLRRQVEAINKLSDVGMFFWDYGNAFLLEAQRAGKWILHTYSSVLTVKCIGHVKIEEFVCDSYVMTIRYQLIA